MANILVNSLDHLSATAFYRTWGVFKYINKTKEIKIKAFEMPKKLDWRAIQSCDVAYFERPYTQDELNKVLMFKRLGVPVWVDYDDNLFDIQIENPAHQFYPHACHPVIKQICSLADRITVSTDNLVNHYGKAEVIRNALPKEMINNPLKDKQDPYIVWRGGLSHEGDIYSQWDAIKKLTEKYQVLFLGATPNFIKYESKFNQNIKIVPPMTLENYFAMLMTIHPKCFIVPLADNEFNKGKSNIAGLEALVTGAMFVSPNWDEWKRLPTRSVYNNKFYEAVELVMNMGDVSHRTFVTHARAVESEAYLNENMKRVKVIKELLDLGM